MIKFAFLLSLLATLIIAGCQKEAASDSFDNSELKTQNSGFENLSTGKTVSTAHWYGSYSDVIDVITDPDGDPDGNPDTGGPDANQITVSDSSFIKNGVAELPTLPYQFSYSNIAFDIPSNYNISGDSLIYEVVAKNPTVGSFYDYDVVLSLTGSLHSANLHFVADASAQQYTQYTIGNASYTNIPALVNYFSDFKTIKLVLKKNQTAAYVNNVLLFKFNYKALNQIGRLQTINVSGKGYVIVDNVKLTNSVTNKKILTEDFNTDGKSHTIFY